jgi:hypothetical protein
VGWEIVIWHKRDDCASGGICGINWLAKARRRSGWEVLLLGYCGMGRKLGAFVDMDSYGSRIQV